MPDPGAAADRCGTTYPSPVCSSRIRTSSRVRRTNKRLRAVVRRYPDHRRVIEKDQIDIARVIELIPAELAHAEHEKPAVLLRLVRDGEREEPFARRLAQEVAQRRAQRRFGKAAQRAGLLLEGPQPGKLGDGGEKRDAPLWQSAGAASAPPYLRQYLRFFRRRRRFAENGSGAVLDKAGQKSPFFDGDAAQKGAVAENRREQAACQGLRRSNGARDRAAGLSCARDERLVPGFETESEPAACRPVSAAGHHRGRGEITVSSGSPAGAGTLAGRRSWSRRCRRRGGSRIARQPRVHGLAGAAPSRRASVFGLVGSGRGGADPRPCGFGLWRLMQGPIDLDELTPYVQQMFGRSGRRACRSRFRAGIWASTRQTHAARIVARRRAAVARPMANRSRACRSCRRASASPHCCAAKWRRPGCIVQRPAVAVRSRRGRSGPLAVRRPGRRGAPGSRPKCSTSWPVRQTGSSRLD